MRIKNGKYDYGGILMYTWHKFNLGLLIKWLYYVVIIIC